MSERLLLPWIMKAVLAAGGAFAIGMLLLGLPGAVFVELVTGLGRKLPPDGEWPLAIMLTQIGAVMIVPASIALRFTLPDATGGRHALATALLTSVATLLLAMVITREPSPRRGPEGPSGQVVFDYSPDSNRIVVGTGIREFTLHLSPGPSRSAVLLNTPSNIDRIAMVTGGQKGQFLNFKSLDSTGRLLYLYPGEHALIRNTNAHFMQIKITSTKSKHDGDAHYEVVFEYQINEDKSSTFSAL